MLRISIPASPSAARLSGASACSRAVDMLVSSRRLYASASTPLSSAFSFCSSSQRAATLRARRTPDSLVRACCPRASRLRWSVGCAAKSTVSSTSASAAALGASPRIASGAASGAAARNSTTNVPVRSIATTQTKKAISPSSRKAAATTSTTSTFTSTSTEQQSRQATVAPTRREQEIITVTQSLGAYRSGSAPASGPVLSPNGLPFLDFRTNNSREVLYTKCENEANRWLETATSKIWAFDLEWRPFVGYRRQGKVALVQLGDDKTVYLLHLRHMKGIPSALLRLLQDESILKVGVNIRNDGTKLFKDWGIHSAGLVELGALCIQVLDDLPSQRKVRSMESLTNDLLGHSVEKVELTRMGNWENFNLSSSQIAYAANDAFVTYEVAARIKELQASRPPQQYTLPLLSIQPEGGFVREVHQTLEEYQNNTGARDNRGLAKKAALAAGISDKSGTTTTLSSSRQSKRVVIKPASGTGAFYTNKKETPVTSKSTTTKELPSPSVTLKPAPGWTSKSDDGRLPLEVDKAFFYNNLIRRDGSIPFGGQSTVTIISKKDSKGRSFSTSTRDTFSDWSRDGLFVEENEDVSDTEKDLAESTFCVQPQDLTIPAMFSVPSLEDKSVLERNQVFWEETVGSMAKEEEEEGDSCDKKSGKDGDDEALLRNQSLFASISNSHI